MERVILIAGGNIGDVRVTLDDARRMVAEQIGEVVAASGVYTSQAWGFESDSPFLNQVWVVDTLLDPEQALQRAEDIERALGREPKQPRGDGGVYRSRTMDIDILFWGSRVISTDRLTVPHPLIEQRRFVLEPLCELMPDLRHPASGLSVKEMLDSLPQY